MQAKNAKRMASEDVLVRDVIDAEFAVVAHQFFPEGEIALRGAVFQRLAGNGLERIQTFLRCGQVWLSDVQVIDFYAPAFGLVGQRSKFTDGG